MKRIKIILDRDGVINIDSEDFIKSPNEWVEINDSIESIVSLQLNGWNISIATNQSGIGRAFFDIENILLLILMILDNTTTIFSI